MTWDTPYLWAIKPTLPAEYASKIQAINSAASADVDVLLDNLIRFVIGAECSTQASVQVRQEWMDKQPKAQKALDDLRKPADIKRPREGESDETLSHDYNKRPRRDPSDDPLFTLHAISTTSPVRKKVDIAIDPSSIHFIHPSTNETEATIAVSAVTRAFILPTRGKQKAHWTVVLLSSDVPDRSKISTTTTLSQQIIFGIDAIASTPLATTAQGSSSVMPKNSSTLPMLHLFLSHLSSSVLPVLEPFNSTFRSACSGPSASSPNGVPGVEAYRAAKVGTLWFMKEGILWGDSKPCEFWAVGDLAEEEGVKMVSATGRTCSVYLKRRGREADDEGDVCEFGMVDGREQEGIRAWAKLHLGQQKVVDKGKGKAKAVQNGQKQTINDIDDNSDASDESFATEDSDESSGSDTSSDGQGSEGEARESGSDAEEDEDEGGDWGSDEELRASDHPLMRPGAVPRMSRATIDAVAEMVESDLLGRSEEEDELDGFLGI